MAHGTPMALGGKASFVTRRRPAASGPRLPPGRCPPTDPPVQRPSPQSHSLGRSQGSAIACYAYRKRHLRPGANCPGLELRALCGHCPYTGGGGGG